MHGHTYDAENETERLLLVIAFKNNSEYEMLEDIDLAISYRYELGRSEGTGSTVDRSWRESPSQDVNISQGGALFHRPITIQ
jgi:hypothetical protein